MAVSQVLWGGTVILNDLTMLLAIAVLTSVNAMVLAWAALLGARRHPALLWSAGSLFMAIAAASVFLVPETEIAWRGTAFNVPILLSHMFWLLGILHFLERTAMQRWIILLVALSVLATLYLSWIAPDRELRVFLAAMTGALLRAGSAFALLVVGGSHDRRVATAAAAVMLVDAVVLIDHAVAGLAGSVPVIGTDPAGRRAATWISMLLNASVATPLLMLLGLSRLLDELRRSAYHDSLTGLLNRRGFFHAITALLADARRRQSAGSVLMLDIDRFKELNDLHGHAAGDAVLRTAGSVLADALRGADSAARWGGEEFCVLLPGASTAEAEQIANRLRETFAQRCQSLAVLAGQPVSLSVGVASGQWQQVDFDRLQKLADSALYRAKNGGRNRVAVATFPGAAQGASAS